MWNQRIQAHCVNIALSWHHRGWCSKLVQAPEPHRQPHCVNAPFMFKPVQVLDVGWCIMWDVHRKKMDNMDNNSGTSICNQHIQNQFKLKKMKIDKTWNIMEQHISVASCVMKVSRNLATAWRASLPPSANNARSSSAWGMLNSRNRSGKTLIHSTTKFSGQATDGTKANRSGAIHFSSTSQPGCKLFFSRSPFFYRSPRLQDWLHASMSCSCRWLLSLFWECLVHPGG